MKISLTETQRQGGRGSVRAAFKLHAWTGSAGTSPSQKTISTSAFTFVEVLAAMLFLAILVPAILQALTLSNRASEVSERSAVAAELAGNKLSDLTLNNLWTTADAAGDFGDGLPGYRYQITQAAWDTDTMTALTVDVFYTVQGQERSVQLVTLVSP